jgi:hypothetical protein
MLALVPQPLHLWHVDMPPDPGLSCAGWPVKLGRSRVPLGNSEDITKKHVVQSEAQKASDLALLHSVKCTQEEPAIHPRILDVSFSWHDSLHGALDAQQQGIG